MYDPKLMPGTNHCKCAVCGEYFTTPHNFDMHRRRVSRNARTADCVYPGGITDKKGKARLHLNTRGLWASTGGAYIPKPPRSGDPA